MRLARIEASATSPGPIAAASGWKRMRYFLAGCALLVGSPVAARSGVTPTARASFGSARTTTEIQQCLAAKLKDIGEPADVSATPTTSLAFGSGTDQIVIEILDSDDLRLVTVKAVRKIASRRQDDIRSCMY